MSDTPQTQPPGWYYAQGDPPGTQRYWDGTKWEGGPQPVPGTGGEAAVAGSQAGLAEPVNRIAGRIVDVIIWIIISIIFSAIFIGGSGFSTTRPDDVSLGAFIAATLLGTLAVSAYEVFMIGTRGQTLGKMALGTKVVREDGSAADMKDAVMRILPYLVLGVLGAFIPILPGLISFIIGVVSLVFLFTDARRQTIWDKIAKTIVVPAK